MITSSGAKYFEGENDSDYQDLLILDFTEPGAINAQLKHLFFASSEHPPNAHSDETAILHIAGFATQHQTYDLAEETSHLGLAKIRVLYPLDAPSKDHALIRLKPAEGALTFDPDGMSGAAAFVVQFVGASPKAFFAGVVCRSSRDFSYIIKSSFILAALRSFDA